MSNAEFSLLLTENAEFLRPFAINLTKDHESAKLIDSLSKIDTVIVNKIKTIKQKEYVQIKVIDSLPISGLQKFFSDRYPQR